jgi:hypothetical protein
LSAPLSPVHGVDFDQQPTNNRFYQSSSDVFRIAHPLMRGSGAIRGLSRLRGSSAPRKPSNWRDEMRKILLLAATALTIAGTDVRAQVELKNYADANGYIDVQKLTCAQLAGTFQEDADMLTAWYSGWYNGLAKKHFVNFPRAKGGEHELILYCKAHPEIRIIQAIAVLLKDERILKGIEMK